MWARAARAPCARPCPRTSKANLTSRVAKQVRRGRFTVELVVHKSPRYSAALLRFIAEIGYEALLIEEEVGWPIDTRNILALPRPNIDHAAAATRNSVLSATLPPPLSARRSTASSEMTAAWWSSGAAIPVLTVSAPRIVRVLHR